MAEGLSTPNPSLSCTHLCVRRGHTTTTHYTLHQVSLVVSHSTKLVLPWGCTLGQPVRQASVLACEGSMCHPKRERKKESELLPVLYNKYLHDATEKFF